MKKNIRHQFSHVDPETITIKKPETNGTKTLVKEKPAGEYSLIKKDLLRTFITIGIFIAVVLGLYLVEQKTGLLRPILSKFGL
jgi:hypothetical protein